MSKGGDVMATQWWRMLAAACLCLLFTACQAQYPSKTESTAPVGETGRGTRVADAAASAGSTGTDRATQPESGPDTGGTGRWKESDSPFQSGEITRLTLYTKKDGDMFSGEIVQQGTITGSEQLQAIRQRLIQDEWRYYPTTESGWVKCQPVYAGRVLIFETGQGRQIILHIPYDGSPYVAAGEFDADKTYASIFRAAVRGDASGEMFRRYTVSQSLVDELCRLYETAA